MSGTEYPKIYTLYERDERHSVNVEILKKPEFAIINKWSVTEKINGENIRATIFDSGEVKYGGRSDDAWFIPEFSEYLKKTFTQEKMKDAFWRNPLKIPQSATIYGEGYGPNMAAGSGIYRKDVSFRLFDCLIINDTGKWWLGRSDLEKIAKKLGIKCVPIIAYIDYLPKKAGLEFLILNNRDKLVITEEGNARDSGIYSTEGIIAKTEPLLFNNMNERVMWKLKVKDFKK